MKDSNFSIKIHDFLSKKTLSDTVVFTNKFSTLLPQLKNGLSCEILIQAGDEKTFMMTIKNLRYSTTSMCDFCWEECEIDNIHDEIFLKFFGDCDEELLRENEIGFSLSDGDIDIQELLSQEIFLESDIQTLCTSCSKNAENKSPETEEGNSIKRVY